MVLSLLIADARSANMSVCAAGKSLGPVKTLPLCEYRTLVNAHFRSFFHKRLYGRIYGSKRTFATKLINQSCTRSIDLPGIDHSECQNLQVYLYCQMESLVTFQSLLIDLTL